MKIRDVIEALCVEFGPEGKNPHHLVDKIVPLMPDKDVPDHVYQKVMKIGHVLKKAGVPR